MSILYFDIVGGISGDMSVAALLDLGVPLELLRSGLSHLGVEGIQIASERAARHQIAGTRFVVSNGFEAPSQARPARKAHEHEHGPADSSNKAKPGHPHRPYAEVRRIVEGAALADGAKSLALRVFAKLAEAEGAVHGVDPEQVEFHEVGAWDSITDVVCAALALDHLKPTAIYASCVPLGAGTVRTAHGIMPVPGPATLELLKGFPVETGGPAFERTTPTGAAILAALAKPAPQPFAFVPERIGIGIGGKDPPEFPNLLRAVIGRAGSGLPKELAAAGASQEIIECAEVNLDDANPQWIGYLMERLLAAGALDVVLIPVYMKKNRPGTLVQTLYRPELHDAMQELLLAETTTLGVRTWRLERTTLAREIVTVTTPWGEVSGKVARLPGGPRFAPEFESCRIAAQRAQVPLQEVYRAAQAAFEAKKR
jgi:hypothetical protein